MEGFAHWMPISAQTRKHERNPQKEQRHQFQVRQLKENAPKQWELKTLNRRIYSSEQQTPKHPRRTWEQAGNTRGKNKRNIIYEKANERRKLSQESQDYYCMRESEWTLCASMSKHEHGTRNNRKQPKPCGAKETIITSSTQKSQGQKDFPVLKIV